MVHNKGAGHTYTPHVMTGAVCGKSNNAVWTKHSRQLCNRRLLIWYQAERARKEWAISPDDNLLMPRFYIAEGLEGWLRETVKQWMATRPNWMT